MFPMELKILKEYQSLFDRRKVFLKIFSNTEYDETQQSLVVFSRVWKSVHQCYVRKYFAKSSKAILTSANAAVYGKCFFACAFMGKHFTRNLDAGSYRNSFGTSMQPSKND